MKEDNGIPELFAQYLQKKCSAEEAEYLLRFMETEENATQVKDLIAGHFDTPADQEAIPDMREVLNKVHQNLTDHISLSEVFQHEEVEHHKWRFPYFGIAASTLLVCLVGIGGFWYYSQKETAKVEYISKSIEDAAPGRDRATLTLSDGSVIEIDQFGNQVIAGEPGVKINKSGDGQLTYTSLDGTSQQESISFNTVSTPRGGQFRITLPDGTKVWLNSASSITYPTRFASGERTIDLKGEAYLEVKEAYSADGKKRSGFKVKLDNGYAIQVLGTQFNVDSYGDNSQINTTLFEGKVHMSNGKHGLDIKPGEQAIGVLGNDAIRLNKEPDMDQVAAWRNNNFYFNGEDLQSVMRDLSRWYDVEVEFRANIKEHFTGIISRDVKASEVFDMLERTGAVKLRIENKKIIVERPAADK